MRLAAAALRAAGAGGARYQQGQRPEPRTREYFYYIDHQGQLFLDDTKVKNFITCFKEWNRIRSSETEFLILFNAAFLAFFFKQLERNRSGRYEAEFPFLSLCGRERNFLRCDDLPVVFTHLVPGSSENRFLSFGGAGERLVVPFEPEKLAVKPENGRLYHPAPARAGGVGLVRSALAAELSVGFEYGDDANTAQHPTHFQWDGRRYRLTRELLPLLRAQQTGLEEESLDVTAG